MQMNSRLLLIPFGMAFVIGCAGLKPPIDMTTYKNELQNEQLVKRAKALDPKLMKAAEKDYANAVEACDDSEQAMCDHYSTLAKIKLETVLEKVRIADGMKLQAEKIDSIETAKRSLETEQIRKDAYAEKLGSMERIKLLESKLEQTSSEADKERMKHKIELEKNATALSNAKELSERNNLIKEAAEIVGDDSVKQTPNSVVMIVRELFIDEATEINSYKAPLCQKIAELILKYSGYTIIIEGHTDSRGRDTVNLAKSQARAQSVMNQFIQEKVPISRMTAVGKGESVPISDNRTKTGKALNRRIEIKFIFPTS